MNRDWSGKRTFCEVSVKRQNGICKNIDFIEIGISSFLSVLPVYIYSILYETIQPGWRSFSA